jgi:hypothetical protein
MAPIPTADKLSIYLNDHLAGATAGVELARRLARSNEGTAYGTQLAELAAEIAQDRDALLDIMDRLAIGRDRLKVALSWGAEKAGRLKLNGALLRYSPLSRLEELEGLSLGVHGKLVGWLSLRAVDDSRLAAIELDELIARARSQARRIDRLRQRAAVDALRG